MKLFRTYKYRMYPTKTQDAVLRRVCAATRAVYNAANEQRRLYGGSKARPDWHGRVAAHHKFKQCKELGLKEILKNPEWESIRWIAEAAPAKAIESAMDDLHGAWEKFFKDPKAGLPKFRNATDDMSFTASNSANQVRFGRDIVTIFQKKVGKIKYVRHKRIRNGVVKEVTVKLEGDAWFICAVVAIEAKDPVEREAAYLGVDLGTKVPVATSEGFEYVVTRTSRAEEKRMKEIQRKVSRARKGSNRRKALLKELGAARRKDAARKKAALHKISHDIAKHYTHVAFEDLKVRRMTKNNKARRAEGTDRVKNKTQQRYNKDFLNIPKYAFRIMTEYKVAAMGGSFLSVAPHYTSQTCNACGFVNKESRKRETFKCVSCGHVGHADTNAAKNIVGKAFPNAMGAGCNSPLREHNSSTPRLDGNRVTICVPQSVGHADGKDALELRAVVLDNKFGSLEKGNPVQKSMGSLAIR